MARADPGNVVVNSTTPLSLVGHPPRPKLKSSVVEVVMPWRFFMPPPPPPPLVCAVVKPEYWPVALQAQL